MWALTEQAPWGTAIIGHGKYLENRTWPPPRDLIGSRFAIHQGKTLDAEALLDLGLRDETFPGEAGIPLGAFLGTVKLHGCLYVHGSSMEWSGCDELSIASLAAILASPWRNPKVSHLWCLKDPRPVATPIPCRGLQKLWRVPTEHLPALEAP